VAVQEGRAVRLFWDPNRERDLGGYRVERRIDDGSWESIGSMKIEAPSFLDEDIRIDRPLSYRVLAIDRATPANVSGPSDVVRIQPVAEPVAPGPVEP
jgi:hypothetical protein